MADPSMTSSGGINPHEDRGWGPHVESHGPPTDPPEYDDHSPECNRHADLCEKVGAIVRCICAEPKRV